MRSNLSRSRNEIPENADQVAAHGAADASVVHLEDFFLGIDHEILIDTDFSELVFDHGDALAVVFGKDAIQKGRLARSKNPVSTVTGIRFASPTTTPPALRHERKRL